MMDPTAAPSAAPVVAPPVSSLPPSVIYGALALVGLWLAATVIAALAPKSRIGIICGIIATNLRALFERLRSPATPATTATEAAPEEAPAPPAAPPEVEVVVEPSPVPEAESTKEKSP